MWITGILYNEYLSFIETRIISLDKTKSLDTVLIFIFWNCDFHTVLGKVPYRCCVVVMMRNWITLPIILVVRKLSVCALSHVWLFAILWTVVHQAPLSMGFPRQEYWSGLLFPSLGDLPDPGSPVLTGRFFITEHLGSPRKLSSSCQMLWSMLLMDSPTAESGKGGKGPSILPPYQASGLWGTGEAQWAVGRLPVGARTWSPMSDFWLQVINQGLCSWMWLGHTEPLGSSVSQQCIRRGLARQSKDPSPNS